MPVLTPSIVPHLWFDKEAKEAAEFYCSIFPDSKIVSVSRIPDTPSGDCEIVCFELSGERFEAISAGPLFKFNESISLMIKCDSQEQIDHFWTALSAVPESEQCGWLKDKYGLSWQVVPTVLDDMLRSDDIEAVRRVTQAFLQMKKFDISALEKAFHNEPTTTPNND